MKSDSGRLVAAAVVLLMLSVPLFSAVPDTSDATTEIQDYYKYVINYTNDVINSVDIYTAPGGPATHITDSKNSIWDFDSEGYGPFNSFYAAVSLEGDNKGELAFILDPNDLHKRIDGSSYDMSKYNIMWVIPTVYWQVIGNSLILSNDPNEGSAYAHTFGVTTWKYVGIGVYEASSATINNVSNCLVSQSGKTPIRNHTVAEFDTYAHNTPGNTILWNYYQWTFTKMATYMVGMGKNTQSKWGMGATNNSAVSDTGRMDSEGPYYASSKESKVFLENTWGSVWEFVGDTLVINGWVYAGKNLNGITYDSTGGKSSLAKLPFNHNGYYSISGTSKSAQSWDLPTSSQSGSGTIGDSIYCIEGNYIVSVGGAYGQGSSGGIAAMSANHDKTYTSNSFGARIACCFDHFHEVTVQQDEHGTVTPSMTKYGKGVEVSFKNELDDGYRLEDIVVYKKGDESTTVDLITKTLWSGSFIMPDYDVVIKPTYGAAKTLRFESGVGGTVTVTRGSDVVTTPIPVLGTAQLTLTKDPNISGSISISNIELGEMTTYNITATPATDYFYKGFFKGTPAQELQPVTSSTVTEAITGDAPAAIVSAVFFRYSVTVESGEGGTVTPELSYHADGDSVTVTAAAEDGYRLASLEGIEFTSRSLTDNIFSMPAEDITITAEFAEVVTMEIGHTGIGSVSITRNGQPADSPITVLRTAEYILSDNVVTITDTQWVAGGEVVYVITAVYDSSHEFELFYGESMEQLAAEGTANDIGTLLNANFLPHTWSIHSNEGGTADSGGDTSRAELAGTAVDITCTPDYHKRLGSITAACIGSGQPVALTKTDTGYRFIMPSASVWIGVVWEDDTVTVTFDMGGHGTPVPSQTMFRGETAVMPEEPAEKNFNFKGWFSDRALTKEWDFATPVMKDMTIFASWDVQTHQPTGVTMVFETVGNGTVSPSTITVPLGSTITVEGDRLKIVNGPSVKIVKAVPDDGYAVESWSLSDGMAITDATVRISFREMELSGMSLYTLPSKLSYVPGEYFDPAGMIVSLQYADDPDRLLQYRGNESLFSFSPSLDEPLKASDRYVVISYNGVTVQQEIHMQGASGSDLTVVMLAAIAAAVIAILALSFVKRHPDNFQ